MARALSLQVETDRYFDIAEREFLIDGRTDFVFPVRRPSGEPDFYERLDRELRAQDILRVHSLREVKEGFTWVSRPASLTFSLEALFRARPHLPVFRGEIESLARTFDFIELPAFLRANDDNALKDLSKLRACLEILNYLIDHREDVAGLLPRQLPHGQSTKLIGRETLLLKLYSTWKGVSARWNDFFFDFDLLDKPLEFRFFAPECHCQNQPLKAFHGLLATEWRHDYILNNLQGTLIVENLESFLALTKESRSTLLIWGGGWKAVHLRAFADQLPQPVYYWGDIDKEGYEIFGKLKSSIPTLKPVLMDRHAIERYRSITQRKEIFLGPFRDVPELQSEYEYVSRHGLQIEQEQMRDPWPLGTDLK